MNKIALSAVAIAFTGYVWAAEGKVNLRDLPPAAQAAVKKETANATLVGLSKEVEDGQTVYEVETKVNGRTRDLLMNGAGTVIEVEEEVELGEIPGGARKSIEIAATGGKVTRVEQVTRGPVVSFEAEIRKNGKSSEMVVNSDGSPHKL